MILEYMLLDDIPKFGIGTPYNIAVGDAARAHLYSGKWKSYSLENSELYLVISKVPKNSLYLLSLHHRWGPTTPLEHGDSKSQRAASLLKWGKFTHPSFFFFFFSSNGGISYPSFIDMSKTSKPWAQLYGSETTRRIQRLLNEDLFSIMAHKSYSFDAPYLWGLPSN